jgi:hypothetical protein
MRRNTNNISVGISEFKGKRWKGFWLKDTKIDIR